MDDTTGYAVFLFPQALDALGEAIKPYLLEGPGGTHVLCREIDTGGSFIEMALDGLDADSKLVKLELMIPSAMVRMVVSVRSDESFGFVPRIATVARALPVVMPTPAAAAPTAPATDATPTTTPAAATAAATPASPTAPVVDTTPVAPPPTLTEL